MGITFGLIVKQVWDRSEAVQFVVWSSSSPKGGFHPLYGFCPSFPSFTSLVVPFPPARSLLIFYLWPATWPFPRPAVLVVLQVCVCVCVWPWAALCLLEQVLLLCHHAYFFGCDPLGACIFIVEERPPLSWWEVSLLVALSFLRCLGEKLGCWILVLTLSHLSQWLWKAAHHPFPHSWSLFFLSVLRFVRARRVLRGGLLSGAIARGERCVSSVSLSLSVFFLPLPFSRVVF